MNYEESSTVLTEHGKIVLLRHLLALVNFLAILIGTVVTQIFMSVRGAPTGVIVIVDILIAVNVVQFLLCLADFITKNFFGLYVKQLVPISYCVGGLWLLLLAVEMILATIASGSVRVDLIVIATIQLITAVIAYLLWTVLDRRALDVLMSRKVRIDEDLRKKKGITYIVIYSLFCAAIVCAQLGGLFFYKLPPRLYDLFENSRALEYSLSDDERGYIVTGVYTGTSPLINVPATYNDLPVIGIASGALVEEENVRESNKVRNITFGTPRTQEDGTVVIESFLEYIESDAIKNNQIESITIPASVQRISNLVDGNPIPAIRSTSLKTIIYEAAADLASSDYECPVLERITMQGQTVGAVTDNKWGNVTIEVSKDIYNFYRAKNHGNLKENGGLFRPLLEDGEFCIDFYTDCGTYIDSIISSTPVTKAFTYLSDLQADTAAYNRDHFELGTNGAKSNSAFRGWYTDREYITEYPIATNAELAFDHSLSLYAKWEREYVAELDWGNYQPSGVPVVQYWTDERAETLPNYTTRRGYAEGVIWHRDGVDKSLVDTGGLHEDLTFHATWLLDKPNGVDILPTARGSESGSIEITEDQNNVSFIYDEEHFVTLAARKGQHAIEDGVTYDYVWTKKVNSGGGNETVRYEGSSPLIEDVADAGIYTLRVVATAREGGESAYTETEIVIDVSKKPLDLTKKGITFSSQYDLIYNGKLQTIKCADADGTIVKEGLVVSYIYTKDGSSIGSDGAHDAGSYNVVATFMKSDLTKRANYEEESLTAEMTIKPLAISESEWEGVGEGWTDNTIVYDGQAHTILLVAKGICPGDNVTFTYGNDTNRKTEAGTYTASVTGISDSNYTYDGLEKQKEWKILQKEITVSRWELDGKSGASAIYSGTEHTIAAIPDGVVGQDKVNFLYETTEASVVKATNVGEYTSRITGVDNKNYKLSSGEKQTSFSWSITKKTLTVTFSPDNFTYNGTELGIDAVISGFVSAEEAAAFKVEYLTLVSKDMVTPTGAASGATYIVHFRAVNAATYSPAISSLNPEEKNNSLLANYDLPKAESSEFKIEQVSLTFDVNFETYTYNGAEQELLVAVRGIVQNDLAKVNKSQFTTTALDVKVVRGELCLVYHGKDAKAYPVSATAFSNENYRLSGKLEDSNITILPKALDIEWTYTDDHAGGAEKTLTNGLQLVYNHDGYTIKATAKGAYEPVTITVSENEKGKDAKSYTSKATLPEMYTNYTFEDATISWSIVPYTLDITWSAGQGTVTGTPAFVYNGSEQVLTPGFTTLSGESVTAVFQLDEEEPIVYTNRAKDVGNYQTVITGFSSKNYAVGKNGSISWRITPKSVTVKWTGGTALTYNGQYQGPSYTIDGIVASDITTTFGVRAQGTGTSNSKQIEFKGTGATGGAFTGSTNGFAVDAGSYTAKVLSILKGNEVDGNYTVSDSGRSFSIASKTVRLTGNWEYAAGSAKSALSAQSALVYNKAGYTVTTSLNQADIVNHLDRPVTLGLLYSGNQQSQVGGYTATVTGLTGEHSENYILGDANKTTSWKIVAKKVKVTMSAVNLTYNQNAQDVSSYLSVASGAQSDDDFKIYTGDAIALTFGAGRSATDAGSHSVTVTGVGNTNYELTGQTAFTYQIKKRPVQFTWSYSSVFYNGNEQHPTASFQDGNITVTAAEYNLPQGGKTIGQYTVSVKSLSSQFSGNYTLDGATNTSCTYQIKALPLSLEWTFGKSGQRVEDFTYDGVSRTVEATVLNVCGNDNLVLTYSANDRTVLDAKQYSFSVTSVNNDNYTLDGSNSTRLSFTVAKQIVTITWNGSSTVVYDGKTHALTATVKGKSENSKDANLTATVSANKTTVKDVGSYVFTAEVTGNNNFTTTGAANRTSTLTIEQKDVSLRWTPDGCTGSGAAYTATYSNGGSYSVTATLSNLAAGDEVAISYRGSVVTNYGQSSISSNTTSTAGVYTITASISNSNYRLTGDTQVRLTVNPQAVKIVWSNTGSIVYDGNSHAAPTATVTGVRDNYPLTVLYTGSDSITDVGQVTRTITQISTSSHATDATNYTLGSSDLSATLTVTAAEVQIDWGKTEITYDGVAHSLEPTLTYGPSKTLDKGNYRINDNQATTVNTSGYSYTVNLTSTNYVFADGTRTAQAILHIVPLVVEITWSATENGCTATVGNRVKQDDVQVRVSYRDRTTQTVVSGPLSAGDYTATAEELTGNSASNYTLNGCTTATNDFTVSPSAVSPAPSVVALLPENKRG